MIDKAEKREVQNDVTDGRWSTRWMMPERLIMRVISMIDEMMTLLVSGDDAKAQFRQITGHKDLLSSSELDECVTNAIAGRVHIKCLSQVF